MMNFPARAALGLIFFALPGLAQGEWTVRQLTVCSGQPSTDPVISGDGRTVVFVSSCDLVEDENRDRNRELFRWREGDGFAQLTHTENCENIEPALDRGGRKIVFITSCRFEEGNPDGNPELALLEKPDEVKLLTDSSTGVQSSPSLSPSGRRLVFLSSADLAGENADHSQEVFLLDLAHPGEPIRQMTRDVESSCSEAAAADNALAWVGNGKRGEANPDGNNEILASSPGGTLTEITRTRDCENREPQLNASGNLVLFRGNCDLAGKNRNRYTELFLVRGMAGAVQLTDDLAEGVFQPALSGDGSRAAFQSRWGREFDNPDHNPEIFILDLAVPGRPQLVLETRLGGSYAPRLSADGRRLVFYGNTNPVEQNGDGSFEIFFAEEQTASEESPEAEGKEN